MWLLSNKEVISSQAGLAWHVVTRLAACSALCSLTQASYSRNWTRSHGHTAKHLIFFGLNIFWILLVELSMSSGETWSGIHTHNTWQDFFKPICVCTQKHYTLLTNILHSSQQGMLLYLICLCLPFFLLWWRCTTQFSWLKDYVQRLGIEMNRENI